MKKISSMYPMLLLALCILMVTTSCKKDDIDPQQKSGEQDKSGEKQILSFVFKAEDHEDLEADVVCAVDEENKEINGVLPYGMELDERIPTIEVSEKATISPEGAQHFGDPVTYTVTAEDGSTAEYSVAIRVAAEDASSEKQILSFVFEAAKNEGLEEDLELSVDEADKLIYTDVPYSFQASSLLPTIEISEGAIVAPEGSRDFSIGNTQIYTVTAEDGSTEAYEVSLDFDEPISENAILSFVMEADLNNALDEDVVFEIDQDENFIIAEVPYGTNRTALIPTIELSPGAVVDQPMLGAQDFEMEFIYRIIAEDGDSYQEYMVAVLEAINPERLALEAIMDANPGHTLSWGGSEPINNWEAVSTTDGHVTFLNLDNKNISVIPAEIKDLPFLEVLIVNNNSITDLPAEIGQLPALTELALSNNALESLPDEIYGLSTLEELGLSGNELTALPDNLGNLNNLKRLFLNENQLTALPDGLGNLSNLENLSVNDNQLTSLPESIGQLSVNRLTLMNNNLNGGIPTAIGNMTHLERLDLSGNQLTSIPATIGNITSLVTLDLTNNQLTSIPPEISNITSLEVLNMGFNSFTSLPAALGNLSGSFRLLSVNHNDLTSLPVELANLSGLERLYVNYNSNLSTIPAEICALQTSQGLLLQKDEGATCEE